MHDISHNKLSELQVQIYTWVYWDSIPKDNIVLITEGIDSLCTLGIIKPWISTMLQPEA